MDGRNLPKGIQDLCIADVARTWYRAPQNLPPGVNKGGLEVTAGYRPDPDFPMITWTEDNVGRAIFYYEGQLNDRFNTVQLLGPCGRVARQTSRSERPVGGFEAQLGDESGALAGLDAPKVLEAVRRQFCIAHRRLNAAVPEIGLQRARVSAAVRQHEAGRMAQHMRM